MTETLDIAALSGVEQLRLGLSGGFVAPIARTVGFDLTEVEEGRVVFEAVPTAAVYNPLVPCMAAGSPPCWIRPAAASSIPRCGRARPIRRWS